VITGVVIPALDEDNAIALVVSELLDTELCDHLIVVDNGSHDRTAVRAAAAGATVVHEPRRGYGAACLRGIAALPADVDVVVFIDGDGSDEPQCLASLLEPISSDAADLVIGSRALGVAATGSLTGAQRLGNFIAARWLSRRFDLRATDLGPFRAIRRSTLESLQMRDRDYGWTVEMQLKAARHRIRYCEVPVPYRRRADCSHSKISGTVRGTIGAGVKIIGLLAFYDIRASLFERIGGIVLYWRDTHHLPVMGKRGK